MKRLGYLNVTLAWLAVAGMCSPQFALGALPSANGPMVRDVALRDGGLLLGQVVKPNGTPVAGTPIALRSGSQELAAGKTNAGGYFAFSGLATGTYQMVTPAGATTCQVWTAETAPPAAQPGALIVVQGDTVRGQDSQGPLQWMFEHPVILGAAIAAAIAIPIAVSQNHKSHASGG